MLLRSHLGGLLMNGFTQADVEGKRSETEGEMERGGKKDGGRKEEKRKDRTDRARDKEMEREG